MWCLSFKDPSHNAPCSRSRWKNMFLPSNHLPSFGTSLVNFFFCVSCVHHPSCQGDTHIHCIQHFSTPSSSQCGVPPIIIPHFNTLNTCNLTRADGQRPHSSVTTSCWLSCSLTYPQVQRFLTKRCVWGRGGGGLE